MTAELDALARIVRRRFAEGDGPLGDPVGHLEGLVRAEAPLLPDADVGPLARALAVDLVGLGPIQALLDDPEVTDVLVNGPGAVWVERAGRTERTDTRVDRRQILVAVERLVGPLGLRADRSHPIVDARLSDGTRVTVVLDPLAVDGPVMAVRRHRSAVVPLAEMAGPFLDALEARIRGRANVVVFGATGSGKTTLLNALAGLLPRTERVVTIEDVAELRLPGEHVVRLEARPGSVEGAGRVAIRDLVRAALRLRPDRLVVGEVRGAEALDMVWALSTGHRGSMSTLHAASAADALRRLETLALAAGEGLSLEAVRPQVGAAVDVLVGMRRTGGGAREVASVHDVRDGRPVEVEGGR
ncbi:MAG: CpaF family protein [Microthrixaceae bacterium]